MSSQIVVIGAGVAGCTCANLLRQQGYSVTVLEKRVKPTFTIGESISPAAVAVLNKLGFSVSDLDQRFPRKLGSHVYFERERAIFNAANAPADRLWPNHSYNVERKIFDKLLLEKAEAKGAAVIQGAEVTSVDKKSNTVSYFHQGKEQTLTFDLLIDATGFHSPLVQQLGTREYAVEDKTVSIFAHFEGPLNYAKISPYHLSALISPPNSWMWVIPLSASKVSIGLVDRSCSIGKTDFLAAIKQPLLEELLNGVEARFIQRRVVADYSATHYCEDNVFFVGDSAFFADPIFSSGVTAALKTAEFLVESVIPLKSNIQRMHQYNVFMEDYYRAIKRQVDLYYDAIKHPLIVKTTLRWWNQVDNLPLMRQLQDWGNGAFNEHQFTLGLWSSIGRGLSQFLSRV